LLVFFQWKNCDIFFWYVTGQWKNIFEKSKRPQIYLVMAFASIANMDSNLHYQKSNLWTDQWCLLGVYNQTIVVNMVLVNGKTFCRCQKDHSAFSSLTLQIWLVVYFCYQQSACGLTGDILLDVSIIVLLHLLIICYWSLQQYFWEVTRTLKSCHYGL